MSRTCPLCLGTGYSDYAGFAMDECKQVTTAGGASRMLGAPRDQIRAKAKKTTVV